MPGMNGIDLCLKIREFEKRKGLRNVKTILVSGNDISNSLIAKMKEDGVINAFLKKPINFDDVVKTVGMLA
eukprot:CAMPEP_0114579756 /NCGR_PEP_ID=MMETSP0125-20121206/4106_1 /TAXON_ID=485358 ORGANISM="Aristerostoma sp., Strain ATCC 50986" /NCGR_SAMPLE_ID=MMETSP0125 /ASSEMBLY_ACC=CAM_ASM_000245 /LENGTH=70 /DNA_ID=CAMNT_0001770765 /DNA_START=1707 /DNA_END=1919 /DNA_ORIENTATION=+